MCYSPKGMLFPLMGIVLLILISCTKETQIDYPLVFTGEIRNVTSTGAEFHGKISEPGSGIIDYGFVWEQQNNELLIGKAYQYSFGSQFSENFSCKIEGVFQEGKIYHVKAYARDSKSTVYGKAATFISLGGAAPQIDGFSPTQGTWNDTLEIRGKYFSRVLDQNIIKAGDHVARCIFVSDTLLKALVPSSLDTLSSEITVTVFGNTATAADDFELLPPEIHESDPDEGIWFTKVTLTGKNFHPLAKVFFDDKQAVILSASWNKLVVKVPEFTGLRDLKIQVNVFGITNKDDFYFKYTGPAITGISSSIGTFHDKIVVYGKNLPVHSNVIALYVDGHNEIFAGIVNRTPDSIKIWVPSNLPFNKNYHIIIKDGNMQTSPRIKSEMTFQMAAPLITHFEPKQGTFGDVIEIHGANFYPYADEAAMNLILGNAFAKIEYASPTLLKVKVPLELQGISNKLSLWINEYTITTEETFDLNPIPRIDKVEPLWYSRSHPLNIYGEGFNPEPFHNKIWVDNEMIGTNIISPNHLQTFKQYNWENPVEGNLNYLKVEVAGVPLIWPEPIRFYEPWSNVRLDITNTNEVGFSIGDRHFTVSHSYGINGFFEYFPGSNTVLRKASVPYNSSNFPYSRTNSFTSTTKAYALYGNVLFSYDPQKDSWLKMGNFPGSVSDESMAFNAGETGYIIGAKTTEGREVWRYNEAEDSWSQLADFPAMNILNGISFTIHGNGYVGLGHSSKIWEYDPAADKWQEKIDLANILMSGFLYDSSVFIINDFVYISGGRNAQNYSNNTYRYEPISNTISKMIQMPSGSYGGFGFSHNGKGYIIDGLRRYSGYNAIIFDPAQIPPE